MTTHPTQHRQRLALQRVAGSHDAHRRGEVPEVGSVSPPRSTRSTTPALMGRVRGRVGDKRVLGLVKAFLKAGVLTEDGVERDTDTGTPQGGILSPLLANIALSVLDDHFAEALGDRVATRTAQATPPRVCPTTGLSGTRTTSWCWWPAPRRTPRPLRDEVAAVLSPMGLRLSEEKTMIAHIDEGFDFLGLAHPASHQARHGQALRLHLPGQEGARVDHGQGADAGPPGATNRRSRTCCTASTRCCGAGPPTSGTACPRPPSATCAPSSGTGSSAGCAASTPMPTGSSSDGATSRGWWPTEGEGPCSTPAR